MEKESLTTKELKDKIIHFRRLIEKSNKRLEELGVRERNTLVQIVTVINAQRKEIIDEVATLTSAVDNLMEEEKVSDKDEPVYEKWFYGLQIQCGDFYFQHKGVYSMMEMEEAKRDALIVASYYSAEESAHNKLTDEYVFFDGQVRIKVASSEKISNEDFEILDRFL